MPIPLSPELVLVLTEAQRDLLQQNPSGVSREELEIGHALNGYTGPR